MEGQSFRMAHTSLLVLLSVCSAMCQQLAVSSTFSHFNYAGDEQAGTTPGLLLSLDNTHFASEKKYFVGGQLGVIPEIYVDLATTQTGSLKIAKVTGSGYAGRLLKLSKSFFLSGSAGVILGYGQIKSWDDTGSGSYTKVPQLLAGLRTAEQLHIRVKRSAIIVGFEQWFMAGSSSVSFLKIGYSFNVGSK